MNRWLKNCKFWVISSSQQACDASNESDNESKIEIAYTSARPIEIQRLPLVVNIIVTVVAENKDWRNEAYYSFAIPYSNFSSETIKKKNKFSRLSQYDRKIRNIKVEKMFQSRKFLI